MPVTDDASTTLGGPIERLGRRFPQTLVALPSGARVAVRTAGERDAPVVVLLHGIGSGAASWLGVAEALAGAARVVAWEAPGYGASSPVDLVEAPAPVTDRAGSLDRPMDPATAYAARLAELLRALEVDACVLVGHSLGALIAAAFATGPDAWKVRRLVLLSPAAGYGAPGHAAERAQVRAKRLATLQARGIEGIADDAPGRMLSAAASDEARAWVRWNASRLDPAGYAQAVELLCDADIGRAAGRLAMPCEVHCGEHDVVTPPAACRAVADRLGAAWTTIGDAGHASPVEQPADVAQRISTAVAAGPADAATAALPQRAAADVGHRASAAAAAPWP